MTGISRRAILGALTAGSALATAPTGSSWAAPHSMDEVDDWIEEQVDFLESMQVASGAVLAPTPILITPYFVSWAMMSLARVNTERARTIIGRYIEWYLAHLNTADQDPYGFAGTVFVHDYDPETGAETSTGEYSSVDAGVTTPITMARDAYRTGDPDLQALVLDNIDAWELMAEPVLRVEPDGVADHDGLCWQRPGGVKYVQDNAVVWKGLRDLAWLERRLRRADRAIRYDRAAATLRHNLLAKHWNTERDNWNWALGQSGNPSESTPSKRFMPDAWCQHWQAYTGLVAPTDRRAVASWTALTAAYPDWPSLDIDNDFPHTETAVSAVLMDDADAAAAMLAAVRAKYAPSGWGLNWHAGESGHFLRAALLLRNR